MGVYSLLEEPRDGDGLTGRVGEAEPSKRNGVTDDPGGGVIPASEQMKHNGRM
jgi:hypothetical protein